jgi:hypothetical protein
MSKTCTINIWNEQDWELDGPMLEKCMQVAARHAQGAKEISVYPQLRSPPDAPAHKRPGWLEWLVVVISPSGGRLTIGVIQRSIDAEFETHT